MINLIPALQTSIKKRFIVSIGLMLLPMLLLASIGYVLFISVVHSFEDANKEAVDEINTISKLQQLVLKAAMPANDYLIHGEANERLAFLSLSKEVEKAFAKALNVEYEIKEEKALVLSAQKEWRLVKEMSEDLLSISQPIGNRAASEKMKLFDRSTDHVVDLLEKVTVIAHNELHTQLAYAYSVKKKVSVLIAVMLGLGLASSVIIAIFLSNSIIVPVRALEKGSSQFAAGDLSSRITLLTKDELGHLARTFNDMAAQIEHQQNKLEELSIHDGLTGIFNRREFEKRMLENAEKARRYGSVFSLIMADIDHFKSINDTFGHQAGDSVLKEIGNIFKKGVRAIDIAARYGGEEFVIILTDTDDRGALVVAERLRATVEGHAFLNVEGKKITISLGVSAVQSNEKDIQAIIKRADEALYTAKKEGRNRVTRAA